MAYSPNTKKTYAMKVFNYNEKEINESYLNEKRFSFLKHQNVISIIRGNDKYPSRDKNGKPYFSSYLLMELACCDFDSLMKCPGFYGNEKLTRTFFQQLIEGIEYLQSQGVAHLDIKPENLLLGTDVKLKITDFDLSYKKGDRKFLGKGSIHFRAPELMNKMIDDPQPADIFSAAIIAFVMNSGYMPYLEDKLIQGNDLYTLLTLNPTKFWEIHNAIGKGSLNEDFKDLFISMTRYEPQRRATIREIKSSKWYNGEIYSDAELKLLLKDIIEKGQLKMSWK